MPLLTQNKELKEIGGVWNWTIPAWKTELSDGSAFNTCPSAGVCAEMCYARTGKYMWHNVKFAHTRNLELFLNDHEQFEHDMLAELSHKRMRPNGEPRPEIEILQNALVDEWMWNWANGGGKAVRIHDAGDFFSNAYLASWVRIIEQTPDVLFYAYTKEVRRFRKFFEDREPPDNFRWCYSYGGKLDHMIDPDTDRHAEVFVDEELAEQQGYLNQEASDLLTVMAINHRIAVPANNIKFVLKKMDGKGFGELQRERKQEVKDKVQALMKDNYGSVMCRVCGTAQKLNDDKQFPYHCYPQPEEGQQVLIEQLCPASMTFPQVGDT